MSGRSIILVVAFPLMMAHAAKAGEFRGLFDRATLENGKQAYPRLRVEPNWHPAWRHGAMRYQIENDSVLQTDSATGKVVKRLRSPGGGNLQWMGVVAGTAFLIEEQPPRELGVELSRALPAILRLDLNTTEWSPSLNATAVPAADSALLKEREAAEVRAWEERIRKNPQDKAYGKLARVSRLADVLVTDRGTLVLTQLGLANVPPSDTATPPMTSWPPRPTLLGCQIALFLPDAEQPSWSRWIDRPAGPGKAILPVFSRPDINRKDNLDVHSLTWLHDRIVVCVPWSQELLCLFDTGEEAWRLPRIWEFERGFIGPSVFEYYLDRFAVDDIHGEESRTLRAPRSERFYQDYSAWIFAGPAVVEGLEGHQGERLFLAVAKERRSDDGGQEDVPECIIYEVDSEGEVQAMVKPPRMVEARKPFSVSGGLVWPCDAGSLLRLAISDPDFSRGFHLAEEGICRLTWYREYEMRFKPSPFVVDPSPDVACANETHLFRPGAGYQENRNAHVHCFAINVVDLNSGQDQNLTLSLPFEGEFPKPESSSSSPGFLHIAWPYPIHISNLEIKGSVLRVVIADERTASSLEFDVKTLLNSVPSE
jgi:hypothetical protein